MVSRKIRGRCHFSGYYGKKGDPVLVAYPGQEFINCNPINSTIWDQSGLKEGDRAVIELNTKEKYLVKENTFHLSVPMEKGPETSDEVFANFRALTCTTLKENYIYRSASPCDNTYNRVETVDALLEKAGIRYVVDLADTKEELDERLNSGKVSDYYRNIILSGNYFTQRLGTPGSEDYSRGMAEAARAILSTEGPFLVHCLEGKDRTGFLCVLLEAVSGASYEEIQKDYMMTYQNYFNITKEQTQEKYDAILENYFLPITEMVRDADSAREYLLNAGMLPEEIDALIEKISK